MTLQEFQRGLIKLGYDLGRGGADGIPGRMTQAATIAFKTSAGLSATPLIGPQTIAKMIERLASVGVSAGVGSYGAMDPVWLIEAKRYLGVREVAGRGSNPVIMGWAQRLGARVLGISYGDDDIPWCGLFVAQCIAATLPKEALPGIVVRASAWDKFGAASSLKLGAVVRLQRPGGGHVFFATGVTADGKHIRGVGGNQSNRVSETMFEASRVVAIRFPTTGGQARPLPIVNARGIVVSRNEQ